MSGGRGRWCIGTLFNVACEPKNALKKEIKSAF